MIQAILFDLDGTLADTAPDLSYALNRLRERHGKAPLPFVKLRPNASRGARGLLEVGFDLRPDDAEFQSMRDEFLDLYAENLVRETRLFDGVVTTLDEIERRGLRWGIVTNKVARFTEPLVAALGLAARAATVISGDSAARAKPHPDTLFAAARALELAPRDCIYVGDDERDAQAARAAAMKMIVAGYGYLGTGNAPANWQADAIIDTPQELLDAIARLN